MPGFMQSIKSHLPQSPFSPLKKGAPVIVTPEVMTPATEVPVTEEQTLPEALPTEALVQPNSSTVALTLTPANGESSQHLTLDDAEVTPEQPDVTPEVLTVVVENLVSPESTEVHVEAVSAQIEQPIAEEAPIAQLETPTIEAAAAETAPLPEVDVASSLVPTQVEARETNSDEQVAQEATAPSDEVTATEPSTDSAPAAPEADSAKPSAKSCKDGFSCHVKRSKSKKTKTDSTETSDVVEPAACKLRKSHPLAGKLRNVIEQVRSKVKKDKDALINKSEPTTPPAVEVIEPAPVCEEIAAVA